MNMKSEKNSAPYSGFEQGPIRPPSEADSLLIRVTRNCPWNHCTFCPVYKGSVFSIRPVSHVKQDIDAVHRLIDRFKSLADEHGRLTRMDIRKIFEDNDPTDSQALQAALNWYSGGMTSIFIQDANSLIIKPAELIEILTHLKNRFPWVDRITSYARSHTIARISDGNLEDMRTAGLNRIHIGLESGSDQVLEMTKKGVSKEIHIKAGVKVKRAGIELSEYVMPGLGGQRFSKDHALETADALNRINPDFIRLRTLAIPNRVPLFDEYSKGRFKKCTDRMMVKEIMLFLENLNGIDSMIKSDHILNLFQEVEGKLPEEKNLILAPLRAFARLDPEKQCLYQVGRRLGIFSRLSDMDSSHRIAKVEKTCRQLGITPENVDDTVDELMKRFI
jgi:radical SAM family protein